MDEEPGPWEVILHQEGRGLQTIADTHRSFDGLHFVLLHPFGHDGWNLDSKQVDPKSLDEEGNPVPPNTRLTSLKFYSYHLQSRPGKSDALLRACRLFQEYVVVNFAKMENNTLYYLRQNQDQLRVDLYNNLCDAIHRHDVARGWSAASWKALFSHLLLLEIQETCFVDFKTKWRWCTITENRIYSSLLHVILHGLKSLKLCYPEKNH